MQRKATKNTRGPNADEKRFQAWLKDHDCVWCGHPAPSIVDHCRGATFKHNKTLIGHWMCVSQCASCDFEKTTNGKRQGNESKACTDLILEYQFSGYDTCPDTVFDAIIDWGR